MQPWTLKKSVTESLSREGGTALALLQIYSRGRRDGSGCVSPSVVSGGFLVCSSREGLGGDISFLQAF